MKRRALFLAWAALAVLLFTQQASAAITDCDQWTGGPWRIVYNSGGNVTAGTYEMMSYANQLPAGTATYFLALGTTKWDCAISFKRRPVTGATTTDYKPVIMGRLNGTAGVYYFYDGCTGDVLGNCTGAKYSSAPLASMPSNSVTFTASPNTAKMVSGVKTPLPEGDYHDLAGSIWKFTFDAAYDRIPGDDWGNITGDYNVTFGPLSSVIFNYNPPGSPVTMDWYIDGLRSDGRKVAMYLYTGLPYYEEWDSAGTTLNGPYSSKPYKALFKEAYYSWAQYHATFNLYTVTYGLLSATKLTCVDADGDTYGVNCVAGPDCDDTNSAVHPGATEICGNNIDDNCNGQTDEGCTTSTTTSVAVSTTTTSVLACIDGDGDTYGVNCPAGPDCDDTNSAIYQELTGYVDADGDTYTVGGAVQVCSGASLPSGYRAAANGPDCDDTNSAIYQNLNGYTDADGDGYGTGTVQTVCSGAALPTGYAAASGDCDDANSAVHPGATEVCNGIDDNCNGTTDEGCAAWYRDADGDTYGNAAVTSESVGQPSGYVANSTDCNDSNSAVHPVDPDVTAPSGAGIAPLPAFTWQNKSPGTVPWYEVSVYSATSGGYVANEWFEAASVCSGGSCTTHLSAALPPGTFYWWLNTYGATSCGLKIQPGGKYQQFTVSGCGGPALTAPTGTVAFGTRPAHTFTSSAEWVDLQIYSSTIGAVSSQWVAATSACTMGSCSVTPVRWIMALGQNWWWVNTYSAACGYQFQPDLNLGSYTVE